MSTSAKSVPNLSSVTSVRALRRMEIAAARHIDQALTIGWPALAQSWQRDLDAINARMVEVKAVKGHP